jgi:hypothetical protein
MGYGQCDDGRLGGNEQPCEGIHRNEDDRSSENYDEVRWKQSESVLQNLLLRFQNNVLEKKRIR